MTKARRVPAVGPTGAGEAPASARPTSSSEMSAPRSSGCSWSPSGWQRELPPVVAVAGRRRPPQPAPGLPPVGRGRAQPSADRLSGPAAGRSNERGHLLRHRRGGGAAGPGPAAPVAAVHPGPGPVRRPTAAGPHDLVRPGRPVDMAPGQRLRPAAAALRLGGVRRHATTRRGATRPRTVAGHWPAGVPGRLEM